MAENINKSTECNLTEAQKKQLQDQLQTEVKEQVDRLGEVFAQCWESEEFKQAFIEEPKAIFKEYGVNYAEDKEYVIIDSPEKTMVKVLPYDGIKAALRDHTETWMKKVEDLDDDEGMQIILDGWKEVVYQNTPNKFYISIPHCPDSLTPEELEMVNGGCIFAVFFFVAQTVFAATTLAVGAEVAVWLAVAVAEAAAGLTTAVAVLEGYVVVAVSTIGFAVTQTWLHSSASTSASGTAAGISSTNTPLNGSIGSSPTNRGSRATIR